MKSHWLWLALGFGLLFSLLSARATAHGQAAPAPLTPDTLVLRFDESAGSLDQTSIRAAIAQELSMSLATEGSEQAATLAVSVTAGGEVQLSYRPARDVLTRSVPVTNESDVPRLLAHLAGNLVRNEAGSLMADLQPPPVVGVRVPSPDPRDRVGDGFTDPQPAAPTPPPYLDNAWVFSVLGGLGMTLNDELPEYAHLMLQVSKRFDQLELGVGARFGYGQMRVVAMSVDGGGGPAFAATGWREGYQVTLPLSAEYRVLGGTDAYLQLGGALGARLSGVFNGGESVTSGSVPYLFVGVQATAGFRLGDNHGLILRVGWDVWPPSLTVEQGNSSVGLASLPFGVQLGWQIGW